MHENVAHAANGDVADFQKGKLEKRPCGHDMQGLDFFEKIPKKRNGTGASLDFIEKKESFAWDDTNPVPNFKEGNKPLHVKRLFDELSDFVLRLQIDFNEGLEIFREMANGGCFPNLSCPAHQERFMAWVVHPFDQNGIDFSF